MAAILTGSLPDARPSPAGARRRPVRRDGRLCGGLRPGLTAMTELILGGIVVALLLPYLLWALLRPEDL
ncbi:potassium-transporting ATPase subunit F [Roseomonas stagni]|uniref:Potassium-transporting ATPase subunit F n=1 Tax=Falsiroseomonas algicola TaxID=2716930 RepID=A0A6M1LMK4_9PROT|nr:potassium-transporting ATPase subunit F [Falsiroseomonas algicola]NGM21596.1 potassium-transporting ATPase subunit F [Falsiroseomonas algicola]